ncbi:MAG: hypothetical protein H8E38_12890 [SAR324 cluster bacterium]|nr:hypothetical protein [SAR324 cluster bacterium]
MTRRATHTRKSYTGTMQVSAKTAPTVNNQNSDRAKKPAVKTETEEKAENSVSKKTASFPGNSKLGRKRMPPNPAINNILRADSHGGTMTLRRSYGMVVSGFENVAKRLQLTSEAAEQFGKTVDSRIRELNEESIRQIKKLPEYKSFALDDISELGDELSDLMQEPENYLKAFALLKNSKFAVLMESTESVHRSFAESMKDNGEEKLIFGMLEMIKDLGGLVGFQESTQINQNNSSVNIRV